MSDKCSLSCKTKPNAHEYVDIHGRNIPSVIYEKTNETAFPLMELKQTGVGIYQKMQYARLATVDKPLNEEFNLYMLECAKNYMLENKIAFPEQQIVKSIKNCKQLLTEKKQSPQTEFLKNRLIEDSSNNEILIQVNVSPTTPVSPFAAGTSKRITPRIVKTSPKELNGYLEATSPPASTSKLISPRVVKTSPKELNGHLEETPKQRHVNQESNSKSDSFRPKLRQPMQKALQKITLNEKQQEEHNVIVTCINKRNCIWIRDKANQHIFENIHRLVNEEAKQQKVARKPWKLEKVYMAADEDCWFRCKIVKFNPLVVFFLDYGNMAEVEEIREVSEELAKLPCMAVRLTYVESEYDPHLEDEIKIKIIKQNEDSTYFVKILKQRKSTCPENKARSFFRTPPLLTFMENEQKVIVIHVEDGFFYLRTKECCQRLKEIEGSIEKWIKSAPSVNDIKINQLVLAPTEDSSEYRRAVVTHIRQKKIEVKYLDYHAKTTVDLASLKNVNEFLSLEPITYFRGDSLKGLKKENFTSNDQVLIRKMIENRTKFVVVLSGKNDFDLYDGSSYLSQQLGQRPKDGDVVKQQLQQHETTSDIPPHLEGNFDGKIQLKAIKTYKPQLGLGTYLCGCYMSSDEFALVPAEDLELHIDSVLITTIKDPEPYSPDVGEICFCFYIDQWYRCVISRILNDEFEVILLDFGNVHLMKKDDLRKSTNDITKIPALALPCKLINIPDYPKIEDLLKGLIFDGELYKVDIKSMDNGKWCVEIPSVYQQITKS